MGQSERIKVINSEAKFNVARIEIENSYFAEVTNNIAHHNTGGILIFDLPNLPQQGGHDILVKNNKNDIVAFHNVCSHRLLKLVEKPKNRLPIMTYSKPEKKINELIDILKKKFI